MLSIDAQFRLLHIASATDAWVLFGAGELKTQPASAAVRLWRE
jgi:hypothetical protein